MSLLNEDADFRIFVDEDEAQRIVEGDREIAQRKW